MTDPSPLDITAAVRAQYETFPYPPVRIQQPAVASIGYSAAMAQYARIRRWQSVEGQRALVAGCGTGYEIHQVAVSNPGLAEIFGIDLSQTSIALAHERIRYHGLQHCQAQVGDLLRIETLPTGPFDFIASYGVIHHTADPDLALRNLSLVLAPEGVMMIMLYNRSGRWPIYRIRQALTALGVDDLPLDERIELVCNLMEHAQPGTMLAAHAQAHREYYAHVENVVDNFFHPNDIAYEIDQIPPLLARAGLRFLEVVPLPHHWQLEQAISPDYVELYERFRTLPRIDQLRFVELLLPAAQTQNLFWCCRAAAAQSSWSVAPATFPATLWRLNPLFAATACIDGSIPWEKFCQDSADLPPETLIPVHWVGFPNHQTLLALTEVRGLLMPLAAQPILGEQILAQQQPEVIERFAQWEEARVVVRV